LSVCALERTHLRTIASLPGSLLVTLPDEPTACSHSTIATSSDEALRFKEEKLLSSQLTKYP